MGAVAERLTAAMAALEDRLADTGARLDHMSGHDGEDELHGPLPRDAALSPAQRRALHQLRAVNGGLDDDTARGMHQIVAGHRYSETSRALPPGVAVRLQQMGLVRRRHASAALDLAGHELTGHGLADDVRAALYLDDNPTATTSFTTVISPTSTATSPTQSTVI